MQSPIDSKTLFQIRTSFAKKGALAASLGVLIAGAALVITFWQYQGQKNSNQLVNIAGRQRVLSALISRDYETWLQQPENPQLLARLQLSLIHI